MDLLQPNYPLMLATLAVFLAPLIFLGWLAVRLLRRVGTSNPHEPTRHSERERFVELAERIEAVAEDAQRLEEAQRFTTALLAERGRAKVGDGEPAV